jgi:hypothetical protein
MCICYSRGQNGKSRVEEDEDKDQINVLRKRQMVSIKMYGFYVPPSNKIQIHEKMWHNGLHRKQCEY